MIAKVKKALSQKQIYTVIAASVLAFLIVAYIIISVVIGAIEASRGEEADPLPEIVEGVEDIYAGYAIAYPYIDEEAIRTVNVKYYDTEGNPRYYSAVRQMDSEEPFFSDFLFAYGDSPENLSAYMPAITSSAGFDYTSLYKKDSANGLDIYKLTYLMIAVGVLYFDDKIEMPEDEAGREEMIGRYGLTAEKRKTIIVDYVDKDKNKKSHVIHIGDKTIDGTGYYYTVDDRNCIYKSRVTSFDYALGGFISLIHSRLVAAGLPMDKTFEPYMTTDYKQWKNTLFNTVGDVIADGSKVVFTGNSKTPLYDADLNDAELNKGSGYFVGSTNKITLELNELSAKNEHMKLALAGRKIKSGTKMSLTEILGTNWTSIGAKYFYSIKAVEAVFDTDSSSYANYSDVPVGANVTETGTPVGDFRYAVVTYDYIVTEDGKSTKYTDAHAVIDLEKEYTGAAKAAISAIKALKVGESFEPVSLTVVYDESNADTCKYEYYINDINAIYNDDKQAAKVGAGSEVYIRYSIKLNGEVVEVKNGRVLISELSDSDPLQKGIKEKLMGKAAELGVNVTAYEENLPCEYLMSFVNYDIDELEWFVTREIIASMEFVNASQRDPFYGESLFKNTLTNKNSIYALDATACEEVVRVLGGINNDSSSTMSEGLVGKETVAVGLTPDNMERYGLYANTIYFELPRGIETVSRGEELDDYRFLDRLGFTLYISDRNPDGTRYIGSDMYGIIALVDGGSRFDFLDKSFVEYWARETLAAVSYTEINEMRLDFYMSDLYGSYKFKINHEDKWVGDDGHPTSIPPVEGSQPFDFVTVFASILSESDKTSDSLLKSSQDLAIKEGHEFANQGKYGDAYLGMVQMCELYGVAMGTGGKPGLQTDTYGTSNFKSVLDAIFNTYYTGRLTAEQQQAGKECEVLMRFSFLVKNSDPTDRYVYEFRRLDDRRVMVTLCKETPYGERRNEVSDFYISTFAFKKIARSFSEYINGQEVNGDIGYTS